MDLFVASLHQFINMEDSHKEALREYAEQKAVIKEAEARMKQLAEVIKSFAQVDSKYDLGDAVVSYKPGKTIWKYSPDLTEREALLEEAKKEEEQLGIATAVAGTPYLQVNFKRSKKAE